MATAFVYDYEGNICNIRMYVNFHIIQYSFVSLAGLFKHAYSGSHILFKYTYVYMYI